MELFRNPIVFKKGQTTKLSFTTAVVPAFGGAGASFTAAYLASGTKGAVSVIELGKPYFYTALGMEKRFHDRDFIFFEDERDVSSCKDIKNEVFGINWLLRRPGSGTMDFKKLLKTIEFVPEGKVFLDFSGVDQNTVLETISETDRIIVVIDPLPVKLIEASSFLEKLRLMYPASVVVVNKMNRGIHKNELKRFLGGWETIEITYYPPEKIYKAEYNCSLPDFT